MATEFKVGDVVELNSGSFPMVVSKVTKKVVTVIWADYKNNKLIEKALEAAILISSKYENPNLPPPQITGMIIT